MSRRVLLILFVLTVCAAGSAGAAWVLELPPRLVCQGSSVTVADLATGPVPAVAGQVVVVGQGPAGSLLTVQRSLILRKLVEAGCAGGVVFRGASSVEVEFQGRSISPEDLRQAVRLRLQSLVPASQEGAPAAWFELEFPDLELLARGTPEISVKRNNPLPAGRTQVRVEVGSGRQRQTVPVTVTLHLYGEVPTARLKIDKDRPLAADLFDWQWLDMAEMTGRLVVDRAALAGCCAARTLAAGDNLRPNDLKTIPVVHAGDLVDLQIQRGGLLVTVKAQARQDGCQGQTIPVKNQLNGRLVNARVLNPGTVEWRR